MPALQVRDFPNPLYKRLKKHAEKNHRSIAQQTIVAVELMLSEETNRKGSVLSKRESQPMRKSCVDTPEELAERMNYRKQLLDHVAARLRTSQPEQKKKNVSSRKKSSIHAGTLTILREAQSDKSAFFDWLDQRETIENEPENGGVK